MSSLNQSVHSFAGDLVKVFSVAQTWHEIQLDSQQSPQVFFYTLSVFLEKIPDKCIET